MYQLLAKRARRAIVALGSPGPHILTLSKSYLQFYPRGKKSLRLIEIGVYPIGPIVWGIRTPIVSFRRRELGHAHIDSDRFWPILGQFWSRRGAYVRIEILVIFRHVRWWDHPKTYTGDREQCGLIVLWRTPRGQIKCTLCPP